MGRLRFGRELTAEAEQAAQTETNGTGASRALRLLGRIGGQATDVRIQAEEMLRMRVMLSQILADATGQSLEKIEEDVERDFILSPQQATEYGLIDAVLSSRVRRADRCSD